MLVLNSFCELCGRSLVRYASTFQGAELTQKNLGSIYTEFYIICILGVLYLKCMHVLAYLQSETRKMYQMLMEKDSENVKGFTIGPE